jgi:hypothetical protein
MRRTFLASLVSCCIVSSCFAQADENSIATERYATIKKGLETMIFVKRFEGLETPCLCINKIDNTTAEAKREITNSNYRIRLTRKDTIDPGVKCLSQYYARYMRFELDSTNNRNDTIKGIVHFTYGYPASSLIQYLDFTKASVTETSDYFKRLISSAGTFKLYLENDKYRISINLPKEPYGNDIVFGYIEIVQEAFRTPSHLSYNVYFDKVSVQKGEKNGQIFLNFSSTSHYYEKMYYAGMIYNVLRYLNSDNKTKRANAIWLQTFLENSDCFSNNIVYNSAKTMLKAKSFALPNTEPLPPH